MSKIIINLQRVLKRIDRSLSGPIVEFSEQFLYGHREILMTYAGLDARAMIKGSIEHGWSLDSGRGIRKFTGGRYLYLSWSSARIARSRISEDTTVAIGAPFIYALKLVEHHIEDFNRSHSSGTNRILFFPVHGNEYSQQNPQSQIALFKEKYKAEEASVCLYWVEYINPSIYLQYQQAGFKIICAGFSGQMEHTGLGYSARRLAGSPMGGRPNFLLQTIAMLTTHNKIVFGGLGTALFYAAYLGKSIEVLHKYLATTYLDMEYEYGTSFDANPLEVRCVKYVENYMECDFKDINFSSEKFVALANLELGKDNMLTSAQLKELFSRYIDYSANAQSIGVFQTAVAEFPKLLQGFQSMR
jgi:hypothetical protein